MCSCRLKFVKESVQQAGCWVSLQAGVGSVGSSSSSPSVCLLVEAGPLSVSSHLSAETRAQLYNYIPRILFSKEKK